MVERIEMGGGPSNDQAAPSVDPNAETQIVEKPEWLPEKFASPEDLAAAYSELEQKMSSGTEEESTESSTLTTETLQKYSEKYYGDGLNDTDYKELEGMGVSRELVAQYAAGMAALQDRQTSAMYTEVGGEKAYEAMTEWAVSSLGDAEIAAYNEAVESSNADISRMAIRGLHARFMAAEGDNTPKQLVQGSVTTSGVGTFASTAQVTQAMNDPRYERDPAYRQEVIQKLKNSASF